MLRFLTAAAALALAMLSALPSAADPALPARSSDLAGVRVVVTPRTLAIGAGAWEFEVVMDTHTKPLNDDMARAAVLVDAAGGRHAPAAWQGDPPGGHHRKGVLRFGPPPERPPVVELQISGVGGAGTRTFRWEQP